MYIIESALQAKITVTVTPCGVSRAAAVTGTAITAVPLGRVGVGNSRSRVGRPPCVAGSDRL
jgi:hypothetical protein